MTIDKQHLSREKAKARELRRGNWWKSLVQKGECYYCKKNVPGEEMTMDHVVPISRGGKSKKSNIVACCKKCNSEKKYLTPVELAMLELEKEKKNTL